MTVMTTTSIPTGAAAPAEPQSVRSSARLTPVRQAWPACESCQARPAAAVCWFNDGVEFHQCVSCMLPDCLVAVTPRPGYEAVVKAAMKSLPEGPDGLGSGSAHSPGVPMSVAACLEWRRYETVEECEVAAQSAMTTQPGLQAAAVSCANCAGIHLRVLPRATADQLGGVSPVPASPSQTDGRDG